MNLVRNRQISFQSSAKTTTPLHCFTLELPRPLGQLDIFHEECSVCFFTPSVPLKNEPNFGRIDTLRERMPFFQAIVT